MSEIHLTHFSDAGRARMVNVADKAASVRVAIASGVLRMQPSTLTKIRDGGVAKGNVLAVADVAAVQAAKHTSDTIPMCHTLPLSGVEVDYEDLLEADHDGCVGLKVTVVVTCVGPTGVEMEAMCAVSGALLTVYDMCKSADRWMRLENVQLEEKRGGKSGTWLRNGSGI